MRAHLPSDRRAVSRALVVTRTFVAVANLARDPAERLTIVVEEWVSNVVEHGTPPPGSRIALRLEHADDHVRLTVSDAGQVFDPRDARAEGPNLERGGGAGLELMRAWSRVAAYRRRRGRNRLVLEVPLT